MGQIDIQFNANDALKQAAEYSKVILANAEKTAEAFSTLGKGSAVDNIAKMAKSQEQLLIATEKINQEREKTIQTELKSQQVSSKTAAERKKAADAEAISEQKLQREIIKTAEAKRKAEAAAKKAEEANKRAAESGARAFNSWGNAADSFQFKFNFLGNLAADVFTRMASGFGNFAKSSLSFFLKQEQAMDRLSDGLNGNTDAIARMSKQAAEFQKTSIFSDELIMEQQGFLAAQGRTEAQMSKTIAAAIKLADVMNVDLETAVRMLDGTYEGNIGKMGKLDSRLKDLTASELANGAAIDLINEKYSTFGEADTVSDRIDQLNNAWDDMKANIGAVAGELIDTLLPALTTTLSEMNSMLSDESIPLWEKYFAIMGQGDMITKFNDGLQNQVDKLVHMSRWGTEAEKQYARLQLQNLGNADATGAFNRALDISISKISEATNFLKANVTIGAEQNAVIDKNTTSTKANTEAKIEQMKLLKPLHEQQEEQLKQAKEVFELYQKYFPQEKAVEQQMIARTEATAELNAETRTLGNSLQTIFDVLKSGGSMGDALKVGLGLNDEQVSSIKGAFNDVLNSYQSFIGSRIALAKADEEAATQRIDELQSKLQAEIALNQAGYASNIQLRLKEIDDQERIRAKALRDQEKFAKQQALIEQITQVASTATAVANTFKVWSEVPFVGYAIATAQVAAMLLSIAAAKNNAKAVAKLAKGKVKIGLPAGVPDGVDTIPAMINKGESVINANATDDYYHTLTAINNRQAPDNVHGALMRDASKSGQELSVLKDIRDGIRGKRRGKQIIYSPDGKIRTEIEGNVTRHIRVA